MISNDAYSAFHKRILEAKRRWQQASPEVMIDSTSQFYEGLNPARKEAVIDLAFALNVRDKLRGALFPVLGLAFVLLVMAMIFWPSLTGVIGLAAGLALPTVFTVIFWRQQREAKAKLQAAHQIGLSDDQLLDILVMMSLAGGMSALQHRIRTKGMKF